MGREKECERKNDQARYLKDTKQTAARDDPDSQKGEKDPSGEPTEFLKRLHRADGLLLSWPRQRTNLLQTGNDPGHLLDRPERGCERTGHHDGRHDGRATKLRMEQF